MTLKEWRKNKEMTQADMARAIPLSQGFLSEIENNGTLSLPTAIAIRDFTGGAVSVDDLLRADVEAVA